MSWLGAQSGSSPVGPCRALLRTVCVACVAPPRAESKKEVVIKVKRAGGFSGKLAGATPTAEATEEKPKKKAAEGTKTKTRAKAKKLTAASTDTVVAASDSPVTAKKVIKTKAKKSGINVTKSVSVSGVSATKSVKGVKAKTGAFLQSCACARATRLNGIRRDTTH